MTGQLIGGAAYALTDTLFLTLDYRYFLIDQLDLEGGTFEGDTIVCPYHGAEFCLKNGEVRAGPAWEAIDTYPVKIDA